MTERKTTRRRSQILANWLLGVMSWKLEVNDPGIDKFVMIGAPHTSNWDFIYFLLLRYGSGIELNWVGKDSLFRGPLGPIMRRLGGVPVNRRARKGPIRSPPPSCR